MKHSVPASFSFKTKLELPLKAILATLALATAIHAEPVKLIFDTDMGNDIDDAQALSLIHNLADRGMVDLLAVTSTKDHELSAPFIDAVNTFYGRPDIPIGVVHDGAAKEEGKFLHVIKGKNAEDDFTYPHDLLNGKDAPEAVSLLRKTLSAQPDGSVHIAQVGFFTNLVRLLDSPADDISPLTGKELIEKKVKELVIMAGAFDPDGSFKKHREYNVIKDIPSAQSLAEKWPGTVLWSGFEIGMALRYPSVSIREDYNSVPNHIIKEAYIAYCGDQGKNPTWDLTCPLQIIYPDRGYFGLSERGDVQVADDGLTTFKPNAKGNDIIMRMDEKQRIRVLEAFVQLCPHPPAR